MAGAAGLSVRGVGHAYGPTTVLDGIDFDLEAGRTVALLGPSGCGKTTLLHLVAGLLACEQGSIENRFAASACVFQQPRLLPWETALDNVALGLKARGVAARQRRDQASRIATRLGLSGPDLDKFPYELSGGMQSRVALARALVIEPGLLLLDEPFAALDIGLRTELYALLAQRQAQHGTAVLMITHDLMEAVRLSHLVLVMQADPGRIVHRQVLDTEVTQRDDRWVHATTAELLQQAAVRTAFDLAP